MRSKKFINLYTGLIIGIIIILSAMALMSLNHADIDLGTVNVTYNESSVIRMFIDPIQMNTGDIYNLTLDDANHTFIGTVYVERAAFRYDLPAKYCLKNETFILTNLNSPSKVGRFHTNVIMPDNPLINNTWLPNVYIQYQGNKVWQQHCGEFANRYDHIDVWIDTPKYIAPRVQTQSQDASWHDYYNDGVGDNISIISPVYGFCNGNYFDNESLLTYYNTNNGYVAFQKVIIAQRGTHYTFSDDSGNNYQNFTINNTGSTAISSFVSYIGDDWLHATDIKPMDNATVKLYLHDGTVVEGYVSNGTCYFNLTNDMFVNGLKVMIKFEGNNYYNNSHAVLNLLHNNTSIVTPVGNNTTINDTNTTVDPNTTNNDTNSILDTIKPLENIRESLPLTGTEAMLFGLLLCIISVLIIKRN
ncbi:MAG: hypothetical protein CfClM3_1112 [Methanobrevibacter sp. CfCl-M3]